MKKVVLLLFSILLVSNLIAQNNITVTVMVNPPYSHDIRDYMNQPGKLLVLLVASASPDLAAGREYYRFKLIGSITGDNGIFLRTKESYRPPQAIEMPLGQSKQLTANDVENYFSSENLHYEGITKEQLLRKGLPEGSYTICIQAVDYETNEPLSEEEPFGCSAPFDLRYIEPPQLINPMCEEELEIMNPQFISFQWTMPVGVLNPSTLRYKFRLYELPNDDLNPESMAYSTSPPFFEQTDIVSTNLIYNAAMPMLDMEKKYVWMVIAEDVNEKIQFANKGESEICTFSFLKQEEENDSINDNGEQILVSWPADCSSDSALISGNITDFYVSWIFSSLVPADNKLSFRKRKNNTIDISSINKYKNGSFKLNFYSDKKAKNLTYSTSTTNYYFQANAQNQNLPFIDGQSYWFQVSLIDSISGKVYLKSELCSFKYKWLEEQETKYITKTINGNLRYQFQGNETKTYPLSNVDLKLVKKYILKDASSGKEVEVPENEYIQSPNLQFKPNLIFSFQNLSYEGLSSTTTDLNGNFSYSLSWPKDEKLGLLESSFSYSANGKSYSGTLSRVIRIEPLNNYYAPVSSNIIPLEESTNLGSLTTYVYSYTLIAEVTKGYQNVSGLTQPLANKYVYLFRKSKSNDIPYFEGDIKAKNRLRLIPAELRNLGFKLIAKRKTELSKDNDNKDVAVVNFSNLLQNNVNGDAYYLWAEGTKIETADIVRFNANSLPNNNGLANAININLNSFESINNSFSDINDYSFTVKSNFVAVSAEPPKSIVKGKLIYTYPGNSTTIRPLANTNISIISCYVSGPEGNSKIAKKINAYEDYEDAFIGTQVLGTSTTNGSGEFEFEFINIPTLFSFFLNSQFEVATGKLNRNNTWIAWESDPGTDFRIKYEKKTGSIRRVFRIVVEDENGLYMSPEDDFIIEPLQSKDVGTLTSEVFTYQIGGKIFASGGVTSSNGNIYVNQATNNIPGVECYLLRKKSEIQNLNLPEGEGQNIVGVLDELSDYKIINFDTTGTKGSFEFDNVLFRNANAPVYFYYRTPKMKGTENYDSAFIYQNTINPFAKPRFFFNNDYNYSSISGAGAVLKPAKPGIRGKVISDVNAQKGVKNAFCLLRVILNSGYKIYGCLTDEEGYFDLSNKLTEIDDITKIKEIVLTVGKLGFYYNENGKHKKLWVKKYDSEFVQSGKQIVEDNIPLSANGGLKGIVQNEYGKSIDAYVRFDENRPNADLGQGELTPTWSAFKGAFNISAIPGDNRKLIIIPKDVAYFSDTLLVDVKKGASTFVDNIVIKERSHRIYFYVKKSSGGSGIYSIINPLIGARVKLLGDDNTPIAIANNQGRVELNFKNVSVNHLSLQISGPIGSNYVPKIVSFKNEESKTPVKMDDVVLKPGLSLKGIVKLDGNPTSKALVYIDLRKGIDTDYSVSDDGTSNTESQYFFQTSPKSDGSFELKCIPPELKGKQITIKAVYKHSNSNIGTNIIPSGSTTTPNSNNTNNSNNIYSISSSNTNLTYSNQQIPTVIGDSKMVYVGTSLNPLQLNLSSYTKMAITKIWGFPLEITDLKEITGGKVSVSGRVKLQGYSKSFDPIGSMNYEILGTVFTPSDQMLGNVPIGVPQQNKVVVSSNRKAKMKYAKSFNVELSTKPNEGLFVIEKASNSNNNSGKLSGLVHIIDNSFQYPSSYLNFEGTQFYFAKYDESSISNQIQPNSSGISQSNSNALSNLVLPVIDIFKSSQPGNGNDVRQFRLCNVANENSAVASNLSFKFINFYTTARAKNSYIKKDKITLDATLNANIENAGQVSINIGELVLKNNTIDPISSNKSILISLKDGASVYSANAKPWQIEAFDWVVDPQQGGLVSKNCMLHTGKLDLPIKEFNLRSDFAYVGDIELKGINLGGYPVQIVNSPSSTFGYNQSTGSDQKGHWQLIIFPNGGMPPGIVNNLPHLSGQLQIETISLLSNGEDVFGIGPGAAGMQLYNTVKFNPLMLNTLPDGFVLSGGVDFNIPNVKQGVGTKLTYSKSSGAHNLFVDPIDITFEGLGNVLFKPSLFKNQQETKQAFNETQRRFTAYGTVEEQGLLEPVQVLLTYDAKYKNTKVVQSPEAPDQKIKIGKENTYLSSISCAMTADTKTWDHLTFGGDLDGFDDDQIDPANRRLNFTVFGEIKGKDQKFNATSIGTPFGGLEITYENGRMLGTLTMVKLPLGQSQVSGVANMLMDKDGWAFYSSATATNIPVPEPATLNAGILIGNYPSVTNEMKNTVLTYAINKEMPETFKNDGLKGFYMIGGRDLPLKGLDIDVNVVVAKAYVEVPMAGVDASFYMNFANGNKTIGGRLDGGIQILFGLHSVACTELSGDAKATIGIVAEYNNGSMKLEGESLFSSKLSVSQGVGALGKCIDAVSYGVEVEGGIKFTPPFDVQFKLYKPKW